MRGQQDHRAILEFQRTLPAKIFSSYYKFAFVRNPWARAYSWYRNVMRDAAHRVWLAVDSSEMTFRTFLLRYLGYESLAPQLKWITNQDGEILVDFVGRYERLEADFAHVRDALGLADRPLSRLVIGDGSNYLDQFTPELVDLVAEFYAEEVELFGYRFGNGVVGTSEQGPHQ
ncbi:hypothetical protein JOD67_006274 [Tenggerimyces flavus]|nr:hypothetical protein [Tenggerimyces flavus]